MCPTWIHLSERTVVTIINDTHGTYVVMRDCY